MMAWWGTCYVLGGFLATVFATFAATQTLPPPAMGWRRGFLFPAIVLAAGAAWFGWFARAIAGGRIACRPWRTPRNRKRRITATGG